MHRFRAEKGGAHYGWEWDSGLFKKIKLDAGWINLGPKPLRDYLGGGEGY